MFIPEPVLVATLSPITQPVPGDQLFIANSFTDILSISPSKPAPPP
jgi:hypothetical protein